MEQSIMQKMSISLSVISNTTKQISLVWLDFDRPSFGQSKALQKEQVPFSMAKGN